jgi:hypothetical protein
MYTDKFDPKKASQDLYDRYYYFELVRLLSYKKMLNKKKLPME